ncbi:hypothetical protein RhiirC2_803343 [Rhizophagus irregularis]|uniref:Uncharacterized protein n=1 Tax=Rhizophagus irregularis TaxID=588596 RepID=A0A2N1LN33_9GLOM|nr:hypothetical protein RhiirC2_803343 [Rhizophagus irregularis]
MPLIICLFVYLFVHLFICSFDHENVYSIWQLCKLMTEGIGGSHQHHFRSYWICLTFSHPYDGVGILLYNPLYKHVQTIDSWNGRLLKLDLFFHQTKISIISLYYPPSGSTHQSICNDLIAKLLS